MKGFSGFGNSPVKQDSNAPEMPKNPSDRKIMQQEWDSLSTEEKEYVIKQQSKVKPVIKKETVVVEGEAPAKQVDWGKQQNIQKALQAGIQTRHDVMDIDARGRENLKKSAWSAGGIQDI